MQTLRNNGIRNFPSERKKGIIVSVIIHILLLVFLILFSFSVQPRPETEEGILVNFGTGETGLGPIEPSPPAIQQKVSLPPSAREKVSAPPQTKNIKKTDAEPLLTQNTEEAPEVKKTDPEAEKKKLEKINTDKKIKEQLQAEKIRKQEEEIERKRIAAEERRQTDIMNRTKNALANSKNAGTNSRGEGVAGGEGNQGDPSGSIDSKVRGEGSGSGNKGTSFVLEGRKSLDLPDPTKYDYQADGKVVVEVSVDRSGKVVQAYPGKPGTTILNEDLQNLAQKAALKALFEANKDAPVIQKGTITYNFKFKK